MTIKKILASGILLIASSAPAHSSEQDLLRSAYLTIYSVLEFIEMNIQIEGACRDSNNQPQAIGAFTGWREENAQALQSLMQIKALYEQKAIQVRGDSVRQLFSKQYEKVLEKAVKVTLPFHKGTPEQVSQACQNWNLTMKTEDSQFKSRANSEVAALVSRRDEIIAAINNDANW